MKTAPTRVLLRSFVWLVLVQPHPSLAEGRSDSRTFGPVDQTSIADGTRVIHRLMFVGQMAPDFEQVSAYEDDNQLANRFNQPGTQDPSSPPPNRFLFPSNSNFNKDSVEQAINAAFMNAMSGDVVYIHFQALGGLLPDAAESGELNGSDEFLRLLSDDHPDAILTDDELAVMVSGLPAGVALLVVIDSCYGSGFAGGADDIVESDFVKVIGTNADCPFDPYINLSSTFVSFTEDIVQLLKLGGVISGDDLADYLTTQGWDLSKPTGSPGSPHSGKSRYDGAQPLPTLIVDDVTGAQATVSGMQFTPNSEVTFEVVTLDSRFDVGTTMTDMNGAFSSVVVDITPPGPNSPNGYFLLVATDDMELTDWQLQLGNVRILYVDTDATGADDGTSWTDAYVFLNPAIEESQPGDQIWIAEGTYKPTEQSCVIDNDCLTLCISGAGGGTCGMNNLCEWAEPRLTTFCLVNGVEMYGGFAGTEAALADRDLSMGFETILSGDLNGDDVAESCVDHVDCPNLGVDCLPPGFCVNDAAVACVSDMQCEAVGGICRLQASCKNDPMEACTIDADCFDLGEQCIDGTCIIKRNALDNAYFVVKDRSFDLPSVIDGFTIMNGNQSNGDSDPQLFFTGGAGILASFSGVSFALATIRNCLITENSSDRGAGVFAAAASETGQTSIDNCVFIRNHAYGDGGALFEAGTGTISDCLFEKNVSIDNMNTTGSGGAITWGGNGVIEDCIFRENVSFTASAVYASNAAGLLTNCCMQDNFAVLGNTLGFAGIVEPTITDVLIVDSEEGTMMDLCSPPSSPDASDQGGLGSEFFDRVFVQGGAPQSIEVTDLLTIGLNGSYQKQAPGPAALATLIAGSIELTNSLTVAAPFEVCTPACVIAGDPEDATCCRQPLISLLDSMTIVCNGDMIIDGSDTGLPPFAGTTIPPPRLSVNTTANDAISIAGDFVIFGGVDIIMGGAAFAGPPTDPIVRVGGNFDNRSDSPGSFQWQAGTLRMNGDAATFEVAAADTGITGDTSAQDFYIPHITIEPGASVTFVNAFANTAGSEPFAEALYVGTLTLGAGSTVDFDNVHIYPGTLIDNGATINGECGVVVCGDGACCSNESFDNCPADCRLFTCDDPADCADQAPMDGIRDDNCIWSACDGDSCLETDIVFADMGGPNGACPPDNTADANDRFHALNCFSNTNTLGTPGYPCESLPPAAFNVDAGGAFGACCPDGVCDGNDAFHALNAFSGENPCACPANFVCPCPNPTDPPDNPVLCPSAPGPAAPEDVGPAVVARAGMTLIPSREAARPGDVIDVDVLLISPVEDLRGYQLHLEATPGALELIDLVIHRRPDHVFSDSGHWTAFNITTHQMLAGLDTPGIPIAERAYLATFTYRVSKRAVGTVEINLLSNQNDPTHRTFLFPSAPGAGIEIDAVEAARIDVRSGLEPTSPRTR